jgi:hypothetical protein
MSRKTRILSLAMVCAGGFMVSSASAQILPGNVWPNSDLSTAAPAGIDQVYSFFNSNDGGVTPPLSSGGTYQPYLTGDTNPRPMGWHRGNGDFGTTSAPTYDFYNPSEGSTLNPSPSGFALEINDNQTSNSGEWFSDWNAIPTGTPVTVQFFWEYTNLTSTQRSPQDNFRVTVNFGDGTSDDILMGDPNNLGHTDDLLNAPGSPDLTTWTQVDETLTPPTGATSMRITIDSGGSSQATGQIWVDDISVAVPEPASLAMLSSGVLLLARRRRV